jgi:hypothetical protein
VVVVVAAAVSLVTSSLINFSVVSSLAVAAFLLGTFVPAFRHPRRGRRLERGKAGVGAGSPSGTPQNQGSRRFSGSPMAMSGSCGSEATLA